MDARDSKAGLIVDAHREATAILDLLRHGYRPESFVREMIQNADDAAATHLELAFLDGDQRRGTNPLLHGPLMLIANDGEVQERDLLAMRRAVGGNKSEEHGKVGRFGLGLKSVFHWCESFLYVAQTDDDGELHHGVVNPYAAAGIGDRINESWGQLSERDTLFLASLLTDRLASSMSKPMRLVLCLPLRLPEHCNRGSMRLADFLWESRDATAGAVLKDEPERGLALVLAQCARLQTFRCLWDGGTELSIRGTSDPTRRLGRPVPALPHREQACDDSAFGLEIEIEARGTTTVVEVTGIERRAAQLDSYSQRKDWPREHREIEGSPGTFEESPQKALGHGAVTVLRWPATSGRGRVHARWACFLPLETTYQPNEATLLTKASQNVTHQDYDVLLHGYVFVSPDRRDVYGWTKGAADAVGNWNLEVVQGACLPLVARTVAQQLPRDLHSSKRFLEAISDAVGRLANRGWPIEEPEDLLVPQITKDATRFRCVPKSELQSLREWMGWKGCEDIGWLHRHLASAAGAAALALVAECWTVKQFLPVRGIKALAGGEFVPILNELVPPNDADELHVLAMLKSVLATAKNIKDVGAISAPASADWTHRLQSSGWGPGGRRWQTTALDEPNQVWQELAAKFGLTWFAVAPTSAQAVEVVSGQHGVPALLIAPVGIRSTDKTDAQPDVLLAMIRLVADALTSPATASDREVVASLESLALDLVAAVDVTRLASHEALGSVEFIPAWLATEERRVRVSPKQLVESKQRSQLFDGSAVPRTAPWIAPLAAVLGPSSSVLVVERKLGEAEKLDPAGLAKALLAHQGPWGQRSDDDALTLARSLKLDAKPRSEALRALRRLWLERPVSGSDDAVLYYDELEANNDRASMLLMRLQQIEHRKIQAWAARFVRDEIAAADRGEFSVHPLRGDRLLEWLHDCAGQLQTNVLDRDDREALLRLAATAADDGALFGRLPLHEIESDRGPPCFQCVTSGSVFRSGRDVPRDLLHLVKVVRIPDSDDLQRSYKQHVAQFDDLALAKLMLAQPDPARFVTDLLSMTSALKKVDEIDEIKWLPLIEGGAVAPRSVVVVAACNADTKTRIGNYLHRLGDDRPITSDEIRADVRDKAERWLGSRGSRETVAQDLSERMRGVAGTSSGIPSACASIRIESQLDSQHFEELCDVLMATRPAWSMLQALAKPDATVEQRTLAQDVVELARVLAGRITDEDDAACLNAIAGAEGLRPSKQRELWLAWANTVPSDARSRLLPRLRVCCGDEKWRNAYELTSSTVNVPSWICPHAMLTSWLGPSTSHGLHPSLAANDSGHRYGEIEPRSAASMIEDWAGGLVDRTTLGVTFAFAAGGPFGEFVKGWLGDQDPRTVRRELTKSGYNEVGQFAGVDFALSKASEDTVLLPRLCGHLTDPRYGRDELIEVTLPKDKQSWIEGSRVRGPDNRLHLTLRSVNLRHLAEEERNKILENTCFALVVAARGRNVPEVQRFDPWWRTWGSGSQAAVDPIRHLLRDELRTTLEQLLSGAPGASESAAGHDIAQLVEDWRRDKIGAAQPTASVDPKSRRESTQPQRLETLLERDDVAVFLRTQVRAFLESYGYSPASVLLELLQNADDALNQLATMRSELPDDVLSIEVEVLPGDDATPPCLILRHWGRAINEHGGLGFPAGRSQKWDEDLYFMLRLQVSAKAPVAASADHAASTGRFGLGFKSVHLLSDAPRIRSGSLRFDIQAALLPRTITTSDNRSVPEERSGFRATEFTLPLRQDLDAKKSLDAVFEKLGSFGPLWIAFARKARRLSLPVDRGGELVWEADTIDGAPGWEVTRSAVPLGAGRMERRLLRYKSEQSDGRLSSVVFGLAEGCLVRLPADVPTLWVVAPTGECWDIGFALNADFKLDPGRARVDLEAAATRQGMVELGKSLGRGLPELITAVRCSAQARKTLGVEDADAFLRSVWEVCSGGLGPGADAKRRELLKQVHGDARGLGALLVGSGRFIPSGMVAPWPAHVGPVLTGEVLVAVASGLNHRGLGQLLLSLDPKLGKRHVVAKEMADIVGQVAGGCHETLSVGWMLKAWVRAREFRLKAGALAEIGVLSDADVLLRVDQTENDQRVWRSQCSLGWQVQTATLQWREWRNVLPPVEAPLPKDRPDWADAIQLAGFAPLERIAAPEYARQDVLDVWFALQEPPSIEGTTVAKWAREAADATSQKAAIRYLCGAPKGEAIAQSVRENRGLPWCSTPLDWERKTAELGVEPDLAAKRAIDLFGRSAPRAEQEEVGADVEQPQEGGPSKEEAKSWLLDVWKKWEDPDYREARLAERRATLWPRQWSKEELRIWLTGDLEDPNVRMAWNALLLLATVQGLGLQDRQHQGFLEHLLTDREQRWDLLFGEGAPNGTWLRYLESWSRRTDSAYSHWHQVLPSMYAATRWWRDYAELLRNADKFERGVDGALDPRNTPELSGDPDSQDLPSLRRVLRRSAWVRNELEHFGVLKPARTTGHDVELYPPSPRLTEVLRWLGYKPPDAQRDTASKDVYPWLESLVGPDKASFHGFGSLALELEFGDGPQP